MIVCPLCEHQQPEGDACDVCGRPFPADLAVPVEIPPVEGLEPTLQEAVALDAPAIPELEPTLFEAALALPEEVEGLEPTLAEPIPELAGERVPDLEPTAAEPSGDEATPFPVSVTCRYCRNPAAPGERICAHCGMRLPVAAPAARPEAVPVRMCGCGVPVRSPLCPVCGARNT